MHDELALSYFACYWMLLLQFTIFSDLAAGRFDSVWATVIKIVSALSEFSTLSAALLYFCSPTEPAVADHVAICVFLSEPRPPRQMTVLSFTVEIEMPPDGKTADKYVTSSDSLSQIQSEESKPN